MKLCLKLGFDVCVLHMKVPKAGFLEGQGLYAKDKFLNCEIY